MSQVKRIAYLRVIGEWTVRDGRAFLPVVLVTDERAYLVAPRAFALTNELLVPYSRKIKIGGDIFVYKEVSA